MSRKESDTIAKGCWDGRAGWPWWQAGLVGGEMGSRMHQKGQTHQQKVTAACLRKQNTKELLLCVLVCQGQVSWRRQLGLAVFPHPVWLADSPDSCGFYVQWAHLQGRSELSSDGVPRPCCSLLFSLLPYDANSAPISVDTILRHKVIKGFFQSFFKNPLLCSLFGNIFYSKCCSL